MQGAGLPIFHFYYSTHAQVQVISPSQPSGLRWYIEGVPVPLGSGTVNIVPSGGRTSSLPPFKGTDLAAGDVALGYQLSNTALDLVSRPEDGNYSVVVRVEADD